MRKNWSGRWESSPHFALYLGLLGEECLTQNHLLNQVAQAVASVTGLARIRKAVMTQELRTKHHSLSSLAVNYASIPFNAPVLSPSRLIGQPMIWAMETQRFAMGVSLGC